MFNSVIIDVVIGLVLSFLAVSLAASAITEAISSLLKLREKTLLTGVKDLLNDQNFTGIARDLYNHALVNPLASGRARTVKELTHKPAYIDSRQFALALYGTLSKGETVLNKNVFGKITDPQLRATLETLWDTSAKDVNSFKNNIAVWFDNSMDRVSGFYKRWTQLVSFLVALAIAVIFNVNALYESAQIWARPSLIAELPALHSPADSTAPNLSKVIGALEKHYLIGWVDGPMPKWGDWTSCYIAIVSWLLVAGATLFGASFWFDILQRLTHLKGTGLKPERSELQWSDSPPDRAQPSGITPQPAPQPGIISPDQKS